MCRAQVALFLHSLPQCSLTMKVFAGGARCAEGLSIHAASHAINPRR